jgi:hypothetical protein
MEVSEEPLEALDELLDGGESIVKSMGFVCVPGKSMIHRRFRNMG